MILDALYTLATWFVNAVSAGVQAAWRPIEHSPIGAGMLWFCRFDSWFPVATFYQMVFILVGLVLTVQALKWSKWLVNLIRGAGS